MSTGWIEEIHEKHGKNQINLVDNMEQGQDKLQVLAHPALQVQTWLLPLACCLG
jgi:hypothetical protein